MRPARQPSAIAEIACVEAVKDERAKTVTWLRSLPESTTTTIRVNADVRRAIFLIASSIERGTHLR